MVDNEQKWAEYKKRKNYALFVILGYVPICFAFDLLSVKLLQTDKPGLIVALFWGLMWLLTAYRFIVLPCPHCGRTGLTHPLRNCRVTPG
jgi:hypothetical protein